MSVKIQPAVKALVLLVVLGTTWGSGFAIAKYAMQNGITPLGYTFWQSLGPCVLVSLVVLFSRDRWHFSWQHWRYYLACGLFGIAIPNTNMYFVAPHLPVGLLAVLVNTAPILTYGLALMFRLEVFSRWRFLGVLCGLSGIFCVLWPQMRLPTLAMAAYIAQALLSPLCFAFCAVFIKRYYPAKSSALSLAAGMLLCSVLLLLPLVSWQQAFYSLWPLNTLANQLLLVEIVLSSLGYVIMFTLLKHAGPVYYSLVSAVVVLTSLFWGGRVFAERLQLHEMVAIALIFGGIALITAVFRVRTGFTQR